jgi:DNA-binding MarR family transcriptional regulator
MRKLGTIDLEILHLAINENGKFNEINLENSKLKRFGVGKILDSLASLKDRKMISLNSDGSFSITDIAREILWSKNIPKWARVLRLLQIKSCSMDQISDILKISKDEIGKEVEKLRKSQLVLMSPQRQDEKLVKVFEILSEGIEEIDKTETEGFDKIIFGEQKSDMEILDTVDEIIKEIQDTVLDKKKKEQIVKKLAELKAKMKI